MSFNPKKNKPDSKDAAKLRAEYEQKARQYRESNDAGSKAKLKDEKMKAFQRVVEQQTHEHSAALADEHKVLIRMGKLKTREQVEQERAQKSQKHDKQVERETIVV